MDTRPSLTAQRVARRRAAHQLLDRPLVFHDPLALPMLGAAGADALRADPGRDEGNRLATFLRAFLAVRSRLAEDALALAVGRGVAQYVVLGAGLDTFAWRNPFPGLTVFEVDHPATQALKRERLAEAGLSPSDAARLVAVDFATQQLPPSLAAAGFDATRPAFFAWLGVTPYLEPAVTRATLRTLAPWTRGGGGVVFDYSTDPARLDAAGRAVFERFAERLRQIGEPFRGFFDPGALREELRAMGYGVVSDWDGDALNARWFAGRADGLCVGTVGRIVIAEGASPGGGDAPPAPGVHS